MWEEALHPTGGIGGRDGRKSCPMSRTRAREGTAGQGKLGLAEGESVREKQFLGKLADADGGRAAPKMTAPPHLCKKNLHSYWDMLGHHSKNKANIFCRYVKLAKMFC